MSFGDATAAALQFDDDLTLRSPWRSPCGQERTVSASGVARMMHETAPRGLQGSEGAGQDEVTRCLVNRRLVVRGPSPAPLHQRDCGQQPLPVAYRRHPAEGAEQRLLAPAR